MWAGDLGLSLATSKMSARPLAADAACLIEQETSEGIAQPARSGVYSSTDRTCAWEVLERHQIPTRGSQVDDHAASFLPPLLSCACPALF